MSYEQAKIAVKLVVIIVGAAILGCTTVGKNVNSQNYAEQQQAKLSSAITLLRQDNVQAAIDALSNICSEQGVAGVTDEALFRLALLHLGTDADKGRIAKAKQILKRLEDEYPASPWTAQARPLSKLLAKMSLKLDETRDLRRDLKKLKNLDLELDQKSAR